MKILRNHGIFKNNNLQNNNIGPWYYEMRKLGYNYRLSDIQCALGTTQLKKINKFLKRRNKIAKMYNKTFSNDIRFKIPKAKTNYTHAYHLYPLQINFDILKISKKILFKKMREKKINLQVHYIPIPMQPYYKKNFDFKIGDFPITEKFYNREVSLPIYFSLKDREIKTVIKYLKKFCK